MSRFRSHKLDLVERRSLVFFLSGIEISDIWVAGGVLSSVSLGKSAVSGNIFVHVLEPFVTYELFATVVLVISLVYVKFQPFLIAYSVVVLVVISPDRAPLRADNLTSLFLNDESFVWTPDSTKIKPPRSRVPHPCATQPTPRFQICIGFSLLKHFQFSAGNSLLKILSLFFVLGFEDGCSSYRLLRFVD